jgi:hypothetical protein
MQIHCCNDLITLPSLIDCRNLISLSIVRNQKLTSLLDSSLETITNLHSLEINYNDALNHSEAIPKFQLLYPNLKIFKVSLIIFLYIC